MHPLRLGWATYAMPTLDPFDVVSRLAELGYVTVELTVSEGYTTAPDQLDRAARERLRTRMQDLAFSPPALMDLVAPCANGAERQAAREHFEAACGLCRDLHFGDRPAVVKSPITGSQPPWDGHQEEIRRDLLDFADVAAEHDVVFAIEAHVGTALDTPEKVTWLMNHTDHPHLGLNFDISHFPTERFDSGTAIDACAPFAVHTHAKDSTIVDENVRFQIPGESDFDYDWFFDRLLDAGYRGDIIAEVSAQQWREPAFDPWAAARTAFENLAPPIEAANECWERSE